jgi:hypothetical protein
MRRFGLPSSVRGLLSCIDGAAVPLRGSGAIASGSTICSALFWMS